MKCEGLGGTAGHGLDDPVFEFRQLQEIFIFFFQKVRICSGAQIASYSFGALALFWG